MQQAFTRWSVPVIVGLLFACTTTTGTTPAATAPAGSCPAAEYVAHAATSNAHGWSPVDTTLAPSARSDAAMEYDAARRQVILFGGLCGESTVLGDTWSWDGQQWHQLHPAVSPPARAEAGMAYDPIRDQLVLFGGSANGVALGDTWVWDANGWSERHPASTPVAMQSMQMAFDPITNRVLLVGGYGAIGGSPYPLDTWSWDGTTWNLGLRFGGRFEGAMATDPEDTGVVLFGGRAPSLTNDTSHWDGTAWAQITTPVAPMKRADTRLVPAGPDALLLFAGQGATDLLRDTWLWRQGVWLEQHPPESPSARYGAAIAYDAGRKLVILFGGTQVTGASRVQLGDTWKWEP